jgi:hypothetical protein
MLDDGDLDALAAALSTPPGFHVDFSLRFTDPRPPTLLSLWESKRRPLLLPRRSDFDPVNLKPHLGWLCIAEVLPDRNDLIYRLIGTGIVETVGRDATRRRVSEILPAGALRIFQHLMRAPQPTRTYGQVEWRGKGYISHESLMLPLADDGTTVDRFLIEMVFDRAPAL